MASFKTNEVKQVSHGPNKNFTLNMWNNSQALEPSKALLIPQTSLLSFMTEYTGPDIRTVGNINAALKA